MKTSYSKTQEPGAGANQRFFSGCAWQVVRVLIVVLVFTTNWSGKASLVEASCGDYLNHKSDGVHFDFGLSDTRSQAGQIPPVSRCLNGNCRSQEQAPLPIKNPFRLTQDRPEMNLVQNEATVFRSFGSWLNIDDLLPSQPAFDVAEPPPRPSV